jgi:hypothetical protein
MVEAVQADVARQDRAVHGRRACAPEPLGVGVE